MCIRDRLYTEENLYFDVTYGIEELSDLLSQTTVKPSVTSVRYTNGYIWNILFKMHVNTTSAWGGR